MKALARRLSIDRAVSYALAMRGWQVPSAMVTALLITRCFDETTQGTYYTLFQIIGLQSLADSGLVNILMHAVSHEWTHLRLDRHGFLRGPRRARHRVAAIARFAVVWFLIAGLSLVVIGIAIGVGVFASQGVLSLAASPLVAGMLLAGLSLTLAPLVAILEGCNQVAHVNRYRLMQAVTGSIVVWSCLLGGANLWTAVAAVLVQLVWECVLIFSRYGPLCRQLLRTPPGSFQWRREIWPLQWKIGLQSAAKYLAIFPLIPTIFAWQSPQVAGRVGITWQVLNSLLLVAYAWVRTRAPEFGTLIAKGKTDESNRAFFTATVGSTAMLIAAVSSFWLVLAILQTHELGLATKVATRFLDAPTTTWFALAMIPLHITQCFSIHIRSRKIDPIWRVSILGNMVLGPSLFFAASQANVAAVGIVMLVVFSTVMLSVVAIWMHCNRSD